MELSHLKAFYQVAVTGSFSKAAEELFLSQPALSRQVSALEKEIGLQLFSRQSRKVVLTDAGRRFFVYTEKIIDLLMEAQKEMHELKDVKTGELTVGASTTISNYLLPPILAAYQEKNPGINIHLSVGNSTEVEQMVLDNKVDIGLLAGETHAAGLYQEQFAEDELYFVTHPNHHLHEIKDSDLTELGRETFLCRERGSATQSLLNSMLNRLDIKPEKILVLGDTEAIKRGVVNRMGIAFLSKHTLKYELKLALLRLLNPVKYKMSRPLISVYRKDTRLSPAALAFLSLLRKESARIIDSNAKDCYDTV